MIFFDSHCHLQDARLSGHVDEIVSRAQNAGVKYMLCCGTREQDWDSVAALARQYDGIVPAFGLHPWFLAEKSASWRENLEKKLLENPSAALGEIGLDHAIDERNDTEQAAVFIAQLKLARELGRPLSIHCRRAWNDLMKVLEQQCGLPSGGVIHSYSGPPDLVPRLSELNVSFSFSGSVTYDRNLRGVASAKAVPDDRLFVETDAPDIPPLGIERGKNEPANISTIIARIALIRETKPEVIAGLTRRNGERLFLKGSGPAS